MLIRLNVNNAGLTYTHIHLTNTNRQINTFYLTKKNAALNLKYQKNDNNSQHLNDFEILSSCCFLLKFRRFYDCFNSFRQVNLSLN